jgi:anti-sigma B factor antagonist
MKIDVRMNGGVCVIAPQGDIRLSEGDLQLRDTVQRQIEAGYSRMVLDLGNVRFMDSAGIGEVVASLKRVRESGGDLKMSGLNQRITDLFTLTKLITIFEVHPDENAAVKSFS